MASIHRRGDRWSVRWRDGAGANRQRTVTTLRAAKELAREIEHARGLGRDWHPAVVAQPAGLVEAMEAHVLDRERVLAEGSLRQLDVALVGFLRSVERDSRPPFTLELLSRDSLARYYAFLTVDPGGCSALTARDRVRMVQRAWAWLYDSDRYGAETPRPRRLDMPKAQPSLPPVAPTWAEMDRVIDAAAGTWVRDLFLVLRFTGLRRTQAMGLLWEDVDFEAQTLTVRPELGKSAQERRGRVVPLSAHLLEEFAGWGRREGHLVEIPGEKRHPDWYQQRRFWELACVPPAKWRQPRHAFRKGFISGLQAAAVPQHIVSALVGHDLGITGGVYTDPAALMPAMREAVGWIPAVGSGASVDLDAARSRVEGKS